jgi:hypothetical protein
VMAPATGVMNVEAMLVKSGKGPVLEGFWGCRDSGAMVVGLGDSGAAESRWRQGARERR